VWAGDNGEGEMNYKIKIFLAIYCMFTFMLGLYNVDIGVSMLNNPGFFSSLVLVHVEAGTVYHLGMLLMVMSFFIMLLLVVWG